MRGCVYILTFGVKSLHFTSVGGRGNLFDVQSDTTAQPAHQCVFQHLEIGGDNIIRGEKGC